ncbi:MAG: DUF4446 family protein, partial [Chloroflexi bacterium]|nr:DUF4446 family protein [Chloroflexota bacterium]
WRLNQRVSEITPDTRRLATAMRGKPVPDAIGEILAHTETIARRLTHVEQETQRLADCYAGTVQKVGLARFNLDEEVRGDLSFALALLDATDSGVIITSLYSLEACRIFLRPIREGKTDHDLLPEEQLALARAQGPPGRGRGLLDSC